MTDCVNCKNLTEYEARVQTMNDLELELELAPTLELGYSCRSAPVRELLRRYKQLTGYSP